MPLHKISAELIREISEQYNDSLTSLNLSRNEIARIENLDLLQHLERLDLSLNRIQAIENLSSLPRLRVLSLAGNLISRLDDAVALQIPQVEVLDLSGNSLSSLEDIRVLSKLVHLRELDLRDNPVSQIPDFKEQTLLMVPQLGRLNDEDITEGEKKSVRLRKADSTEEKRRKPSISVSPGEGRPVEIQSVEEAQDRLRSMEMDRLDLLGRIRLLESTLDHARQGHSAALNELEGFKSEKSRLERDLEDSFLRVDQLSIEVARLEALLHESKLQREQRERQFERELEAAVRDSKREASARERQLQADLEALRQQVESQRQVVKHLRAYMGQYVPSRILEDARLQSSAHPAHEEGNVRYKEELDALMSEYMKLQKESETYRIKLEANEKILQIQEQEISGTSSGSAASVVNPNAMKHENLLNRWRSKVHDLLVRIKQVELEHTDWERRRNVVVSSLEMEMQSMRNQLEIAKQREIGLTAERDMDRTALKVSQASVQRLEQKEKRWVAEMAAKDREVERLRKCCSSAVRQCEEYEGLLAQSLQQLNVMDQRIKFANERLAVAMTLVRERQTQSNKKMELILSHAVSNIGGPAQGIAVSTRSTTHSNKDASDLISSLQKEIAHLKSERDFFMKRSEAEDHVVAERLDNLKELMNRQVEEKERRVLQLRQRLDEADVTSRTLRQQIGSLEQESESSREQLKQSQAEVLRLNGLLDRHKLELEQFQKTELARQRKQSQQVIDDIRAELEQTRRALAKANVEQRSMEKEMQRIRQSRERDQAAHMEIYEEKLMRKDEEIRNLRKERSTLLSTIRHLQSSVGPASPSALHSSGSSGLAPVSSSVSVRPKSPKAPIQTRIQNLAQMASKLLTEGDDDDEQQQEEDDRHDDFAARWHRKDPFSRRPKDVAEEEESPESVSFSSRSSRSRTEPSERRRSSRFRGRPTGSYAEEDEEDHHAEEPPFADDPAAEASD